MPPVEKTEAATAQNTSTAGEGFDLRAAIAESVSQQYGEEATADKPAEQSDESEDAAANADDETEATDESSEEETDETTKSDEPAFYTQAELDSIDLYDLDLSRVHPDARPQVQKLKARFTRGFQELAEMRRDAMKPAAPQQTKETAKEEPSIFDLSDDDLVDRFSDPASVKQTLRSAIREEALNVLKDAGLEPERLRPIVDSSVVQDAINIVSQRVPDLASDADYAQAVGEFIHADPDLKAEADEAVSRKDTKALARVIRTASAEVKAARSTTTPAKPAAKAPSVPTPAEAAKRRIEVSNAKAQVGSKAANATSRAPLPKEKPTSLRGAVADAVNASIPQGSTYFK